MFNFVNHANCSSCFVISVDVVARVYPNSLVLMLIICCKSSNVHTFLIVHAVLERYTHFFIIFHKVLFINVHVLFEKVEHFSDFGN